MALTLPYEFDSSRVIKVILRLVLSLLGLVVVAGIAYSLFISHNTAGVALLVVVGIAVTGFGRLVLKNLVVAHGTITAEVVVVHPVKLFGLRPAGSAGRFPIYQFEAVRVERSSGPVDAQGGPNEMVSLIGRDGTPDILIAHTESGAGISLGHELATALRLPYQEQQTPY
jgi:hypothetical protein